MNEFRYNSADPDSVRYQKMLIAVDLALIVIAKHIPDADAAINTAVREAHALQLTPNDHRDDLISAAAELLKVNVKIKRRA